MPISAKEKKKVESHEAREKIEKDMIYFAPGHFSISEAIGKGAATFAKNARYFLIGIPDAIAISLTLYLISYYGGFSPLGTSVHVQVAHIIAVIIAFLVYFTLISAPLSNLYKSKLSGIKYPGTLKSIACSLSVLQPLAYAVLLISIILLIKFTLISWVTILSLIITFILYLISINQSLLPSFLADTKNNRSNAIGLGWLLLSNNSVTLFLSDLIVFIPVMAFVSLFVLTHSIIFLGIGFIAFLISEGIWYGATSFIHDAVSKGKNNYNIA